jgi:hypothetical protein
VSDWRRSAERNLLRAERRLARAYRRLWARSDALYVLYVRGLSRSPNVTDFRHIGPASRKRNRWMRRLGLPIHWV